jgi:hypothetical protein
VAEKQGETLSKAGEPQFLFCSSGGAAGA